jgi:hypothetical protein
LSNYSSLSCVVPERWYVIVGAEVVVMGHIRHQSATTTTAVRRALQDTQESIRTLARSYHLNPKTVAKWKKRATVDDTPMGPKQHHSTVLSFTEEVLIMAFRQQTLLPLDDCLYALQASIPT